MLERIHFFLTIMLISLSSYIPQSRRNMLKLGRLYLLEDIATEITILKLLPLSSGHYEYIFYLLLSINIRTNQQIRI